MSEKYLRNRLQKQFVAKERKGKRSFKKQKKFFCSDEFGRTFYPVVPKFKKE